MVAKFKGLRFALVMLATALFGGPALAAAPEQESAGLQLAAWVAETTDMPAAQIAIVGQQNVYSVEPLGPPAATGAVIARVRTEAVDDQWSAAHDFQSWEAHALFDCAGKRMRIIRSASYAEPNLKGEAKVDDLGGAWFAPRPAEPAAVLLAAACDRNFAWPLRAAAQPAAPDPAPLLKAKLEAPVAAAEAAQAEPAPSTKPAPIPPAAQPRKIEVATRATSPPATEPSPVWPIYEEAASVQKASFTAAEREPVAAQASRAVAHRRLAKFAEAPASAVAAVRRWAQAGEGFVSRRASSVHRWFASHDPPRSVVRQAAL
jgi:hypothetical protein